MAAANRHAEDQFLCSICLDVFSHPVSTPCGHNFCKVCITEHWDNSPRSQCPMCKEVFNLRPDLKVNTFISEMVSQFRDGAQQDAGSSSSEEQVSKPGGVLCDACTGSKQPALKSCLDCLVSFCQTHLEPHLTAPRLKRHQLIEPVESLEDRMCPKHDKPLELFCKTDQTCVCVICCVQEHENHRFVPLRDGYEEKMAELEDTQAEIQQMIQKRRLKMVEIKRSVELGQENADREVAEGVRVFSALKESVERRQDKFVHAIQEKQKRREKEARGFMEQLEEEICELRRRSSEVEQLSRSGDHLHVLHRVQTLTLNQAPPRQDWTQVHVRPASYEGSAARAAAQLEETLREEIEKLLQAELERVQEHAVHVTLDPETAHPRLKLSSDGKEVHFSFSKTDLPDNPERFSAPSVLGKQGFSSGRFYFQVRVKRNTDWTVGVASESVDRKSEDTECPKRGFWSVWFKNRKDGRALEDPPVWLSLRSQPVTVGVFVDHEQGLVSFHDVHSADLIYSFTDCSFSEKLYPYFNHFFYDPDEYDDYIDNEEEDDCFLAPLTISAAIVQPESEQ